MGQPLQWHGRCQVRLVEGERCGCLDMVPGFSFPRADQACVAALLTLVRALPAFAQLPGSAPFTQSSSNPPEKQQSEKQQPDSYGVEIAFSSGHADRGFII